ncbi:porin [Pontibacter beigongshangensis]|uniref:porin n=1 Tax=Pontibacter beigongshangensis TaxID=2574733 RepID=UPI0016500059|nr:porin [Pontibacter beigongshangensis]
MKLLKLWALVLLSMFTTTWAGAQGAADYGSGLKINLNEEGSKYVRFIFWSQIWAKSTQNNPGTLIGNEPTDHSFDIGARRVRTIAYAQLSPRYLIFTHLGINNQTFINGGANGTTGTGGFGAGKKPQIFFHDVWNEYAIIPAKNPLTGEANKYTLYAGAGLHYWLGISRMTSASTLNFLMVDAPIFNWPTLEMSDQFIRQYGLYAKGALGRLHYQGHINKPFATNLQPIADGPAVDNNGNPKASFGGYADFQLFDQEANVLPFRVGTYMGSKKVLNIGAGFYSNRDGTRNLSATGVTNKHDINILSMDVFADLPVGPGSKNMAVTTYSVLYNYDFGPNYMRTTGIMNTGVANPAFEGLRAQEGAGNARFSFGTGNVWYTQAGLLLPKDFCSKVRVQPVAAYTLKNLEALDETGHFYDIGANFFLDAHHAKITVQHSSRPLYYNNTVSDRAGEWIVQFQVYL